MPVKSKKNVRLAPHPEERTRIIVAVRHLLGAVNRLAGRLADKTGCCTCTREGLRDSGDGPCDWCEQLIFAWDATREARAWIYPLVRDDYRAGDYELRAGLVGDSSPEEASSVLAIEGLITWAQAVREAGRRELAAEARKTAAKL